MRVLCSKNNFELFLNKILEGGGEGVIMRIPKSLYSHGRSPSLIKIKNSQGDFEALILSITHNCFQLLMPNGTVFEVAKDQFGPSACSLVSGDVITLESETGSRVELPSNSKFVRVRSDVSWEDICSDYNDGVNEVKGESYTTKPRQFWTGKAGKNLRIFFENYARQRNMDPLVPETWYSISGNFFSSKNRSYVNSHLRHGGYKQALVALFPDIGLDVQKFSSVPAGYWDNVDNRKLFFDEYARKSNFNAFIPENWYNVSIKSLDPSKGLLSYYKGSLSRALMHVYPNIGLEKDKFFAIPRDYWEDENNRRQFFEDFAKEYNFDYLVPKDWYLVSVQQIISVRKGASILKYFSKILKPKEIPRRIYWKWVLARALRNVFPQIKFNTKEFVSSNGFRHRRKFFEDFAAHYQFDPFVAYNWYSINKDIFISQRGGQKVLDHYNGSVMNALCDVFPSIGLNKNLFPILPGHWNDAENRKEFFMNFAQENEFDPLVSANWYSAPLESIREIRGYSAIVKYYNGSILNGIMAQFPNLDISKFPNLPGGHWIEKKNRREFFDMFAKENEFDPLVPSNWYNVTSRAVQAAKGGSSLMKYYPNQSYITALEDVYPDLSFDRHKFSSLPNGYWKNEANRKSFFDSFARDNNFDPLVLDNWSSMSPLLRERKSYNTILQHYKGGLMSAVQTIYGQKEANVGQT